MQSPQSASGDPIGGPLTPIDGRTFLPSLLGFHKSQATGRALELDQFTRGYAILRVKADGFSVSVFVGLASLPTDSSGFLRNLTVTIRHGNNNDFLGGVVNQGMALHPLSYSSGNGIRRRQVSDDSLCYIQMADLVSEAVLGGLAMHADMKGCVLNPRKTLEFFGDGRLDLLLSDLFTTDLDTALKRSDPNSLEWVSDLDFEVGLGIPAVETDTLMATIEVIRSVDAERSTQGSDPGLSQLFEAVGTYSWSHQLGVNIPNDEGMLSDSLVLVKLKAATERDRYAYLDHRGGIRGLGHQAPNSEKPAFWFRPALKGHDISRPFRKKELGSFKFSGVLICTTDNPTLNGLAKSQALAWDKRIAYGTAKSSESLDVH